MMESNGTPKTPGARGNRRAYISTVLLLVLNFGLQLVFPPADAYVVAVYDGPLYVDPGSSSALQSTLQSSGHTATRFTGTPPASLDNVPDSVFVDIDSQEFSSTNVILFPFASSLLQNPLGSNLHGLLPESIFWEHKFG